MLDFVHSRSNAPPTIKRIFDIEKKITQKLNHQKGLKRKRKKLIANVVRRSTALPYNYILCE